MILRFDCRVVNPLQITRIGGCTTRQGGKDPVHTLATSNGASQRGIR